MKISLIAAASENNVIGKDNALPWHLPHDLAYFKRVTDGSPVIMGRKNYESIIAALGKPLPNRRNIIITRQEDLECEGCDVVHSLEEAIDAAKDHLSTASCHSLSVSARGELEVIQEIFIIGGGQIYAEALPKADRVYLTRVHTEIEGDVFFPELGEEWKEVSREHHEKDEEHAHAFTFMVFERV